MHKITLEDNWIFVETKQSLITSVEAKCTMMIVQRPGAGKWKCTVCCPVPYYMQSGIILVEGRLG